MLELTPEQLRYMLKCLDFHYSENYDKKENLDELKEYFDMPSKKIH